MRILVTGGAGFIGSNVVDGLLARGHEVAVFDDLSSGRREFVDPRATLFEGDLARPEAVERCIAEFRPEVVDHHAALPYRPGSWGPAAADALIASDGGWHNPTAEDEHAPCA